MYNRLFSTGMKHQWDQRIYIDLYCGAGRSKVKKTNKILLGSPMLALNLPDQYSRYIFCDEEEKNINTLKLRVEKDFPNVDAHYIIGDSNIIIKDVLKLIPKYSKTNKVLSFCFVDPFALNIHYDTIKKLSQFFVDFLILQALSMDGKRNEKYYIEPANDRIDKFLGLSNWRSLWEQERITDSSFQRFLAKKFAQQMVLMGYEKQSLKKMIEMRSEEKNLPLYHLAFFSRNAKGYDFWDEVIKYVNEPTLFS